MPAGGAAAPRSAMNIPAQLVPESWLWIAGVVYFAAWAVVVRTAPWKVLLDSSRSHAFLGACVFLIVLWHVTTMPFPGLQYHYLGAMLLTLMFRWQLAFVGLNLVLLAMAAGGQADWAALPLNGLVMGLVPALAAWGIFHLVERRLPNHFFVYIFANAFFGAGLALTATVLIAFGLLLAAEAYSLGQLIRSYLSYLPLMFFPEAFITGMLTALLVVFYPRWVLTFDDVRYLQGK